MKFYRVSCTGLQHYCRSAGLAIVWAKRIAKEHPLGGPEIRFAVDQLRIKPCQLSILRILNGEGHFSVDTHYTSFALESGTGSLIRERADGSSEVMSLEAAP